MFTKERLWSLTRRLFAKRTHNKRKQAPLQHWRPSSVDNYPLLWTFTYHSVAVVSSYHIALLTCAPSQKMRPRLVCNITSLVRTAIHDIRIHDIHHKRTTTHVLGMSSMRRWMALGFSGLDGPAFPTHTMITILSQTFLYARLLGGTLTIAHVFFFFICRNEIPQSNTACFA